MTRDLVKEYRRTKAYKLSRRRRVRVIFRLIKWIRKYLPCANCKLHFRPEVIQFDHIVSNDKKYSAAHAPDSYSTMVREILKTQPLCANCHAVRTSIQSKHRWNLKRGIK